MNKGSGKKLFKLLDLIVEYRSISRQQLIQASGLNPRTVSRYIQELKDRNLIRLENLAAGSGQNRTRCILTEENIRFAFFTVTDSEIYAGISDLRSMPLVIKRKAFAGTTAPVAELIAELRQMLEEFSGDGNLTGRSLYAVAVNMAWARPISDRIRERIEGVLSSCASCRCNCYTHCEVMTMLWQYNNQFSGRGCGIICGSDFEFAAVADCHPDRTATGNISPIFAAHSAKSLSLTVLIGENGSAKIEAMREYGTLLGRIVIQVFEKIQPDFCTIMQLPPEAVDGLKCTLEKYETEHQRKLPVLKINFMNPESVLAPAAVSGMLCKI